MNFLSLLSSNATPPQQTPSSTIKRQRRTLGHWFSPINPQHQSPLFTLLPAELRNKIYTYVFSSPSPSTPPHNTHHPLSLLLTCRLISTESSALAFCTHTFHIAGDLTFHGLRLRTKRLPDALFDAIESVSCTPFPHGVHECRYWAGNRVVVDEKWTAEVVRNVVGLLPGVRAVGVRLGEREEVWCGKWCGKAREYVEKEGMVGIGEWRWVWMEGDGEDGVKTAVLVNEMSGRKVDVRISRIKERVRWDGEGVGRLGLLLRPTGGERREDVREVRKRVGVVGYMYDPGEEYWADVRNRRMLERKGEIDKGRDVDVWRDDV